MTAQEFYERYKNEKVRIIKWPGREHLIGMTGILYSYSQDTIQVRLDYVPDDGYGRFRWFDPDEIEPVIERDNKPLPLPG